MFQRLANFWLSSFITEKLLSSPAFHRAAAKTHQHVSTFTDKGQKVGGDFMKAFKENLEKEAKNAARK
ncbi:hypothetical protein DFQ28_006693 [Apophysomyces sp. BC1034]|nr:hypothetical protein DFQ30_004847 [Apophysomyces sp. BC1015]KAG0169511.1 hypothetical protein DFQ29_009654 [Apophysomyces sp. BC1021]KAG0187228.1 hypothetical protein DFQ28_006693 [Apophysomyces sp. BC1034]